ncbi:transposable element Tcb2 transposase [Trichonephila clavipes]|nr:transposable element Tcb2 transposase [Trichonephila clavipes]
MLEAETIQRMEWPACSPDLNPIEHVWDILGRRIAARPRPPATVRDLEIALLEEWNSIPKGQDTAVPAVSMIRVPQAIGAPICLSKNRKMINGPINRVSS